MFDEYPDVDLTSAGPSTVQLTLALALTLHQQSPLFHGKRGCYVQNCELCELSMFFSEQLLEGQRIREIDKMNPCLWIKERYLSGVPLAELYMLTLAMYNFYYV